MAIRLMRLTVCAVLAALAGCSAPPSGSGIAVHADGYRYNGQHYATVEELAPALGDEYPGVFVAECDVEDRLMELLDHLAARGVVNAMLSAGGECD